MTEPQALVVDRSAPTLQAGEPVTVVDERGRRRLFFLDPKARYHSGDGYIDAHTIIGQPPGVLMATSQGHVVAVYRTTYEEYVLLMKRAAQVIPPKDIPFIVQWADVFEGAHVVEAGLGSGALTIALLRAVGERGRVTAFELREDHAARGLKNIRAWPEGLDRRLQVQHESVVDGLARLRGVSRVVLDLPEPWLVLDSAAQALDTGGIILAYLPTIRQIDQFVLGCMDHRGFGDVEVMEVLMRPWVADRTRLRPSLRMVGHSGFLVRARRRGPKHASVGMRPEARVSPGATHTTQPIGAPMTSLSLTKATHPGVSGPVILAVLDGVGVAPQSDANAVALAHTPNLDRYAAGRLSRTIAAHGTAVGMPSDADMGNSEVGHNALGAGRVFDQGAKLVASAIADGSLFEGQVWRDMVAAGRAHTLHFIGLLSDGNVHSHIDQLLAMLRRAAQEGVKRAAVHVLLDGRDVGKTTAHTYVAKLEDTLRQLNQGGVDYVVASGGGRMQITMDRYEADWPMVERGWRTHVLGEGRGFQSAPEALEMLRAESPGINDQELPAFVIHRDGKPVAPIVDGDAVILFNFRGDRMLELTRAFEDDTVPFERVRRPKVAFAGMTLYDGDTGRPSRYLVSPPKIQDTVGELLAKAGVAQLACSETQKFGHVTYFWNGNRSGKFNPELETYVEVPSYPAPFDGRPEMRAPEIVDAVEKALAVRAYPFVRVNFANGDMVGHTGNVDATRRAMEAVDVALGRLEALVIQRGGVLIVIGDHGNAEDMAERDKKGEILRDAAGHVVPKTSHSLNPVPFYVVGPGAEPFVLADVPHGGLGHVASSVLCLLGFAPPASYLPSLLAYHS